MSPSEGPLRRDRAGCVEVCRRGAERPVPARRTWATRGRSRPRLCESWSSAPPNTSRTRRVPSRCRSMSAAFDAVSGGGPCRYGSPFSQRHNQVAPLACRTASCDARQFVAAGRRHDPLRAKGSGRGMAIAGRIAAHIGGALETRSIERLEEPPSPGNATRARLLPGLVRFEPIDLGDQRAQGARKQRSHRTFAAVHHPRI